MHVVGQCPRNASAGCASLVESKAPRPASALAASRVTPHQVLTHWSVAAHQFIYWPSLPHTDIHCTNSQQLWPGMWVGCPIYMSLCWFISTSESGYATKALSENKHQIPVLIWMDENLNNVRGELSRKICWPFSFWAIFVWHHMWAWYGHQHCHPSPALAIPRKYGDWCSIASMDLVKNHFEIML